MTRLAHPPIAALIAFVVGSLAVGQAHAKDIDGALDWIPAEASSIIAIDLEGARATPFFREMQKEIIDLTGFGRDLTQMRRDGIDVLASVRTIVYAGPDDAVRKAKQSLVVLEGTFDQAKLKEYYAKKAKVPLTEKTSPVGPYFQVGDDACVAFNGSFAIFGSKALFESALKSKQAGQSGKNTKVSSLLARFKGGKHGFGVISGSTQLKKILGKDFGDVQDVKGAAITFDFSAGFHITIVGIFADAGKAASVATAIKKQIVELGTDPDMKETGIDSALNKVVTSTSGAEVKLELSLDAAASTAFAKSLKELL